MANLYSKAVEKVKQLTQIGTKEEQSKPVVERKTEKTEVKLEDFGTYRRIIGLLPEEALANLPNEVFKALGFGFIAPFKEALVKMRKDGLARLVYAKEGRTEGLFLPESKQDNFRAEQDPITKEFRYFLNEEEISPSFVIVFGDELRQERAKLHISEHQKQTILRYENALDIFYNKLHTSYAWLFKINGFSDAFKNDASYNEYLKKVNDIANRTADSVVYCDKEDDFSVAQINLSWFEGFIKEYKTKVCVDFNIPFTKFYGESATGFNATGEGDRRSWYDSVKSFQALYIFEQLKQYASLIGKTAEINKIDLENIEQTDKEAEANIQSLELNNIIAAHNNGLLPDEVASEAVARVLNLTDAVEKLAKKQAKLKAETNNYQRNNQANSNPNNMQTQAMLAIAKLK